MFLKFFGLITEKTYKAALAEQREKHIRDIEQLALIKSGVIVLSDYASFVGACFPAGSTLLVPTGVSNISVINCCWERPETKP